VAAEIEEVLSYSDEAGFPALTAAQSREAVLDHSPRPQLLATFGRFLSCAQLGEEALVRMDAHAAAAFGRCGALRSTRTRAARRG